MTESSVRVAVRIRPQMPSEVINMCHVCTTISPGEPQVWLGKDKAFTFDNVFDMSSTQDEVYSTCIGDLINGCLMGYNATILAYGQTGSGKTYTMGTGFDMSINEGEKGIIPRAVHQLFEGINMQRNEAINKNMTPPDFKIVAQFMELYNEEVIDLLDPVRDNEIKKSVKIHEDSLGQIYTVGLTFSPVTSAAEALHCLKVGALSRTTASTNMNVQSSRSHAIFTLHMKVQRLIEFEPSDVSEKPTEEFETLMSKLHFVDLAGSERLKRTGATGERAREGISINCGLLSLGNVISALGDKTRKATHVPYRDSKLTRLLQDSLGGNSQTLMIACVSPSDRDFMETLNTLKYANRAKNIRNKISINQDKSSQTISKLRRDIQQLELELIEYRQGKRIRGENGEEQINDMYHENMFLETEVNNLRSRLKAVQETLDRQTRRVTDLLAEKQAGGWISSGDPSNSDITEVIKGYLAEIEDLRAKLMESEETCSQFRKQVQRLQSQSRSLNSSFNSSLLIEDRFDVTANSPSTLQLISEAKKEVQQMEELKRVEEIKQAKVSKNSHLVENGDEPKEVTDDEKEKEDSPEVTSTKMNGDIQMNGELDDEEEEVEEGEGSSEDSDSEEKSSRENCTEILAQLTQDISTKQKLIEALEQSQQRLHMMKHKYEEKLLQLEQKIRETENERDKVLASLCTNKGKKSDEKVKKVKEEFENKLKSLQAELRKMQVVKKEHVRVMRNQAQCERQIQQLKNEVSEMKKNKVKLFNKMKEDSQRYLQSEQRRNREIAQLKKQSRIKENQIRSLESENRLKENVLKRRQEELTALRKSSKLKMSDRVAGRVPQKANLDSTFLIHRNQPFSPKVVKNKWQSLEKSITQLVLNKRSISCIDRDMERYLKERDKLTKKLENLQNKRYAAVRDNKSLAIIHDYDDNIESLKANIDYCQENIDECQSSIMQLEETKEDVDVLDVDKMVFSMQESKYLLTKLINMTITQTLQSFQKDAALKESEEKLRQAKNERTVHVELLERLVTDGNAEVLDFVIAEDDYPVSESQASTRSNSPVDSSVSEVSNFYVGSECSKSRKRRRQTRIPSQIRASLANNQSNMTPAGSCPSVGEPPEKPSTSRLACSFGPELQQELDLDKTLTFSPNVVEDRGIVRVTSAPTSLQELALNRKVERSPLSRRRTHERQSHMADFSPAFRRKFNNNASVIPLPTLSRQSSTETTISDITPPNSPTASRKDSVNVFSRLTNGSFRLNKPGSGVIHPFTAKTSQPKDCPLMCTHVAEGHSRAILSLAATDDVLFSSSKDRTVKVWDLSTGKEIQSLGGHHTNVCVVRYSEYSRLAYSVYSAYIKVWDLRENPAKCVQTLSSSGAVNSTLAMNKPSSTRTLQMPQGESQIHDIALNRYGTTLYSAASNLVRVWDLRTYKAIGKLSGSSQATIMCLAVDDSAQRKNTVVTGSKDHYIKVFEVTEEVGGLYSAKIKLDPPHYDGIQSLALNNNTLFSGSRDSCLKKWDLRTGSHIQSVNQAHKDWILALSFFSNNDVLLSGCRGGFLKLWSTQSTQCLGDVKAHSSSINAIAVNKASIFTASSDCTIGIWSLKNDLSPESNDYGS